MTTSEEDLCKSRFFSSREQRMNLAVDPSLTYPSYLSDLSYPPHPEHPTRTRTPPIKNQRPSELHPKAVVVMGSLHHFLLRKDPFEGHACAGEELEGNALLAQRTCAYDRSSLSSYDDGKNHRLIPNRELHEIISVGNAFGRDLDAVRAGERCDGTCHHCTAIA